MSAYTEKNFNAALDAISIIRSHRDMAIRIADAFSLLFAEENHGYDPNCPCKICNLRKQLSGLKVNVITYQKEIQKK